MHTIITPFGVFFSTLSSSCATLSQQFAQLAGHPFGLFGVAAIVVSSLVLAGCCVVWAIIQRQRCYSYRARAQAVLRRSQLARHFRDSLLESLPEMIVILRSRGQKPLNYGGGAARLQHCLDGPDAAPLAAAICDLLRYASGFSLSVRMSSLRQVFVRGLRIGGSNVLFLRTQERFANQELRRNQLPECPLTAIASIQDGAPSPGLGQTAYGVRQSRMSCDGEVIIGTDGRLKQYNQAFARQWSLSDEELRGEPPWAEIADHCIERDGRNAIWDIVLYAATVVGPERLNDWGTLSRANGQRISLAVSRLEDGATRVTFINAAQPSEMSSSMPSQPGSAVMAA